MQDAQELTYRLYVLGRFQLGHGTRRLAPSPSCLRLLGLLAVRGSLHRTETSEALWPGLPEPQSQSNLRTVLWRLRRQKIAIIADHSGYLSLLGPELDLREVLSWCRAMLSGGPLVAPPPQIADELLPGWSDSWLVAPREELQILRLHALDAAGGRFLAAGRLEDAGLVTRAAIVLDPLRESSAKLLIEVCLREGNAIDAVRLYVRFAHRLRAEAGLDPEPETTALVSRFATSGAH
jgi:DNA-binding SARP family transcriptional activator